MCSDLKRLNKTYRIIYHSVCMAKPALSLSLNVVNYILISNYVI